MIVAWESTPTTACGTRGQAVRRRGGLHPRWRVGQATLSEHVDRLEWRAMGDGRITVFLADDNVIVREGVRALLALESDLDVVGTADDYDSLLAGAEAVAPQVLVTDIRMPPSFQQEGIDAAKELRKRHPGTGVVVLVAVRRPRLRHRPARRRRRRLRLPPQGPGRRGQPARPGRARGGDRWLGARPEDRRGAGAAGHRRRRPDRGRRAPAPRDRRGPADQGDRQRARHHRGRDRRLGRGAVPQAVGGREHGHRRRVEAAAHAPHRDRRPRGAGRAAEPAAPRRSGREGAQGGARHR